MKKYLHGLIQLVLTQPAVPRGAIASRVGVSKRTVYRYCRLVEESGETREALRALDADALNALLNRQNPKRTTEPPDVRAIARALRRDQTTLRGMWKDYRDQYKRQAVSYSRFAEVYRAHRLADEVAKRRAQTDQANRVCPPPAQVKKCGTAAGLPMLSGIAQRCRGSRDEQWERAVHQAMVASRPKPPATLNGGAA